MVTTFRELIIGCATGSTRPTSVCDHGAYDSYDGQSEVNLIDNSFCDDSSTEVGPFQKQAPFGGASCLPKAPSKVVSFLPRGNLQWQSCKIQGRAYNLGARFEKILR